MTLRPSWRSITGRHGTRAELVALLDDGERSMAERSRELAADGFADGRDQPDHDEEEDSNLRRRQILDFHAVALLDDLGDPLPVAMRVVALVAQ